MKQIWSTLTKAFHKPLTEGELERHIYFDTTVADEANLPTEEIQSNIDLCKRLVRKIAKTRKLIKHHCPFSDKQILQELALVMNRAENLLQQCMCKKTKHSWLFAAVLLVDMKENVLDIELDLAWWTSLLSISSSALDMADWKEDNVVTMALEQLKTLYGKLTVEGSSLQAAASIDKKYLQAMLAQVKSKSALSASFCEGEKGILSFSLLTATAK